MTTSLRTCLTCSTSLPVGAPARQIYCSKTCRNRADNRRRRGQPMPDRPRTADEDQQRSTQLLSTGRENQQLRRLTSRLHHTRRKYQRRAEHAEERIEVARRTVDEIEARAAEQKREQDAKLSAAEAQLGQAADRIRELESQVGNQQKLRQQMAGADTYARQAAEALRSEQTRIRKIVRDWDYLARKYFRNRKPETFDAHDRSILTTWQRFRKDVAADDRKKAPRK
ncbi:hypothetical protein NBM05_07400 [Rothia sp. AR01]|uniref:Uncharacterized protein n=1 Tax=Rothia santali TaxID=2949643 RepID=A0A9X2HHK5_9MICC|nr:hypothetical protein [Rothia santali]MCP3425836.1 hypothetical protein [Rothia santali]